MLWCFNGFNTLLCTIIFVYYHEMHNMSKCVLFFESKYAEK